MAKNHIIARHSAPFNLNTGKSFRTENILERGGLADLSVNNPLNSVKAEPLHKNGLMPSSTNSPSSSGSSVGSSIDWGSAIGKVAGAIPAIGTAVNAYTQFAGNNDTAKYETALNTLPQSVSIGSYDALADWRASLPSLSNPTAEDLDTMTTAGKIGTGLSTIASTTAAGAQTGGWIGALAGLVGGAGAVGAGLWTGKKKRQRLADDITRRNRAAEERINAMYLHELGDINEELANQAFSNLAAHGGKIHIKPSKRGTFRAQAKRMGMSVQEAARHILANKNRYSPAMRKKAAFAKAAAGWKHDFGGELEGPMFEFPVEYNHGGYFALDPELIKINQGGTHEQNPLNGVPMGFDENGIPNLVEEGETIFDNYVFSNRLAPTENQLAEGGLAKKYKNHTFADISEKIAKDFEETPTDPIAKESFRESMQRLKTIQEQVRSENAVPEEGQIPEQEVAPESMESVGQPPMEEEMPMEQMPEEMPQNMMEQAPMYPEMMQAYGGNLFAPGGDLESVKGYNYIIRNKKTGEYSIDEDAINAAIERAAAAGHPLSREDVISKTQAQIDKIVAKEKDIQSQTERKEKAKKFILDKYGETGLTKKGFSPKVSEEDRKEFTRIMQGESEQASSEQAQTAATTTTTTSRKASGTAGTHTSNTTSNTTSKEIKPVEIKNEELKLRGMDDEAEKALRKASKLPEDILDASSEEGEAFADDILKAQQKLGAKKFSRKLRKGVDKGETLQSIVDAANNPQERGLPTWMRYAPLAGSALGAIWNAAQKPDYSVAEAAERIASNIPRARFNPIGDYLTYRPLDRNFYLNQVRNQGLANERAILNASGANQGAATAAILANQYNTQNAIGNSLMQQEIANRQNEQQVAQFNRGTNQYNSQGLFNESVYNQRAGMQTGYYGLTAAQLRQAERQRRNAAISADLTNLFQGIGDIGWENFNANMINMNPALNYNINLRGNRNAGATTYQAKCGGMLTRKKSKSRRK